MTVSAISARFVVEACHAAWCNRDLDGLLAWFTEDATYRNNVGPGPDGGTYVISGKAAIRAFLSPVLDAAESLSVVEHFVYENFLGRALVSSFIRDKATGLVLSGNYRQYFKFRNGRIAALEEIHDAARMAAFWRLVGSHLGADTRLATQD